jgi:hypothetical protein
MIPKFIQSRPHFVAPKLKHLWMGLPFFLMLLKGFIMTIPLFDFWWHLKMGQIIVEKSGIPRTDLFSFTAAGKLFVVQNWLAEIFFYGLFRIGGVPFIVFANSTLLAFVLIPIHCICRKATGSLAASVFSVSLVAICIQSNVRPQIFSFLLFAIYYWLLVSYCDGKQNRIWCLPVLMIFWVNLHGAFVLGLALISLILVCEIVRAFSANEESKLNSRQLCTLGIVLALCAASTLANPSGYRVYNYIGAVVNDPSSRQFVSEWQPPVVDTIQGAFLFYIPFFILTFVLIGAKNRPTLTELALYGAFSIFGMTATRNSTWFLIIAAPIIARYLSKMEYWGLFRKPKHDSGLFRVQHTPARKESLVLNFAILIGLLAFLFVQSPWLQKNRLLDPKTPVEAMEYIDKHSLSGNIFHPQAYGDYLIWRLWPGQKSFFDGRVHLFDESFVKSYQQIMMDSHWEELLAKYQIRYLLLAKGKSGSEEMRIINQARSSPGWWLLYEDSLSVILEKRK